LPKSCEETVKKALKKYKGNAIIWIFNLNLDESFIEFEPAHGNIKNPKLKDCLLNGQLPFDPTEFSKIKFLRDEPHPVYTTTIVWPVLKMYPDALTTEEYVDVEYSKMLEDLKTFYPQWVQESEQLTSNRLKHALDFLNKLGFTKKKNNKVRIFYKRGNKVDDLNKYFASKWKENKTKKDKNEPTPGVQSTINKWAKKENE